MSESESLKILIQEKKLKNSSWLLWWWQWKPIEQNHFFQIHFIFNFNGNFFFVFEKENDFNNFINIFFLALFIKMNTVCVWFSCGIHFIWRNFERMDIVTNSKLFFFFCCSCCCCCCCPVWLHMIRLDFSFSFFLFLSCQMPSSKKEKKNPVCNSKKKEKMKMIFTIIQRFYFSFIFFFSFAEMYQQKKTKNLFFKHNSKNMNDCCVYRCVRMCVVWCVIHMNQFQTWFIFLILFFLPRFNFFFFFKLSYNAYVILYNEIRKKERNFFSLLFLLLFFILKLPISIIWCS